MPPVPPVNFPKELVLAVILGYQPSGGGPRIEIAAIESLPGASSTPGETGGPARASAAGLKVTVTENREPGPLSVITNPYHIIKVRKKPLSVLFEREPEGKPCSENEQCNSGEFCEKPLGDCEGIGACKPMPQVCVDLYDPVCGCDGKTYGNGCAAGLAGVSLLHLGECKAPVECMSTPDCGTGHFCLFPEGKCSGPGVCTPRPSVCPLMIACIPDFMICGCNGRSYCSLCELYANGESVLSRGPCPVAEGCIGSGGKISTALCCDSLSDFPNTCLIGACGCPPGNSRQAKICDCGADQCFDGTRCVSLF